MIYSIFSKRLSTKHNHSSAILVSLLLLFTFNSKTFAQNDDIVFERLNTSNGLSNNSVQRLLQDSHGYLWIGTDDGLNKYDGYTFTQYRHDPEDSTSIGNNSIWAIYEDKARNIWIGTQGGLSRFNRETETFKTFNYEPVPNITGDGVQFRQIVMSIYEDYNGTLWLSTLFKGLAKFNKESQSIVHVQPDSVQPNGFNKNITVWMSKDTREGQKGFWVGSDGRGLAYFDVETEQFTIYGHDPENEKSISFNNIRGIVQDSDGLVWVGTDGYGLNKFNPDTKEFIRYKHDPKDPNSLSDNRVFPIYEDADDNNTLWIGTAGGLNKLNKKTGVFTRYKSDINDQSTLSADFIWEIYRDRSGVIWIATVGGLDKIDPGRVPFHNYKGGAAQKNGLNSDVVRALTTSGANKNILWIGTQGGGLNKLDLTENRFSYYKRKPGDANSLASDSVLSVYEDPDEAGEVLWVGTWPGGLNRFDVKNNRFKAYKFNIEDDNTISNDIVRQIYETRDGMLWLGTANGLNRFDRDKQTFTRYQVQDTSYVEEIQNLLLQLVKEKKPISSILRVSEEADIKQFFTLTKETQVVLIGVGEGLGSMYDYGWLEDASGKEIWKMDFAKSRHAGGGIKNRMEISTLSLAAGQYILRFVSDVGHSYNNWNVAAPINPGMWGIQLFEINNNQQKIVATNIDKAYKPNSISSGSISAILEDSYGMLWIGTSDQGLNKFDRKTGTFSSFLKDESPANTISSNIIFAIHEDKKGSLWIGTADGLNRYFPKNKTFKTWTVKDGLPNNSIINILEDTNGSLWLATNNGISKFDPDDEANHGDLTFINYGVQDGLQSMGYSRGAMHSSASGEMFLGGFGGFVSFVPGKSNPQPPRTIVSDFRIFNESIKPGEDSPLSKIISETENISLSYDQNAFSFEFVALHFSRPEKNQYLYKMEGFDKDWIDGYRRYAPYTNLDPGDYTFMVKASNSDGVWNEEGASIKLSILPPWWRTVWAYIGYGLFFVGLIFGIDRLQRRRLLAKTKERLKIQAAEHRAEAAELQARAVQAENERKTKELEEARDLQLSMLPKELPQLPNLDIAVYMQTATEVGGDYYDFHVALDGTLTVVIGDATGHGMKAGTMVTTAKSLFNSYAPNPDILYSFQEITRCIRQMNFGKLSMCLTMLKIKGNKMQISTAGMPPSFIFRRDTRVVEEHLFQAMPLGTMEKFPYEIKDTTLKPGDTILLMSDGLPELENDNKEMYGYKKIRNGFEDVAEKAPEEIITHFKNEGSNWVNNDAPDDDVTFVVIKVK